MWYLLGFFYTKIGLDIYFGPACQTINSLASIITNGAPFTIVNAVDAQAKLIYPISCALIFICFEEKRFWMPRLDPSCFENNNGNFLGTWILIGLPIVTYYLFIPLISLISYTNGLQSIINYVKLFF
tara:strand:- start:82 stop:462 length:381 start_codon:yes stop_codon:yes gene_type:complete